MNSTIVISWVAMGFFVAWISTHLRKDGLNSGVGNLAVGVLGSLLGGIIGYGFLGGRKGYNAFTIYAITAMIGAVTSIVVTRLVCRPGAAAHVS